MLGCCEGIFWVVFFSVPPTRLPGFLEVLQGKDLVRGVPGSVVFKGLTGALLPPHRAFSGSAETKGFRSRESANELDGRWNPGLRGETEAAGRNVRGGVATAAEGLSGREMRETITAHFTMRVFEIYCTEGRIRKPILKNSLGAAGSEERGKRGGVPRGALDKFACAAYIHPIG